MLHYRFLRLLLFAYFPATIYIFYIKDTKLFWLQPGSYICSVELAALLLSHELSIMMWDGTGNEMLVCSHGYWTSAFKCYCLVSWNLNLWREREKRKWKKIIICCSLLLLLIATCWWFAILVAWYVLFAFPLSVSFQLVSVRSAFYV
jgi:hypothetical protein